MGHAIDRCIIPRLGTYSDGRTSPGPALLREGGLKCSTNKRTRLLLNLPLALALSRSRSRSSLDLAGPGHGKPLLRKQEGLALSRSRPGGLGGLGGARSCVHVTRARGLPFLLSLDALTHNIICA